jgi:hypothetical protein
MKYLFILHLLLVAVILGCRDKPDPVQEFIPGTYIRFSQHEFGNEYDTLIISIQNSSADEYGIIRKWKYERVVDGQKLQPEYKRSVTTAVYNSKHKLLREYETGDIYSFDVREKILFNGPVKYQKL